MSYSALCKRVEDLEPEPELARELCKSLSVPGAAIEVQLVTSCKSHEPPGAVTFRNIHGVPRCGQQNNTESNCSSSRLCTVTLATSFTTSQPSKPCLNTILCVSDIEEFIMSGDPEILACNAAGLSEQGPEETTATRS